MKPSTLTDYRVQGDLGGQKIKLSFDENSVQHLMSVLTDLYSDPELAIIREYSTNAYDSHVEAGNSTPIEVITPTRFTPFFKIIDHGVGLSGQDITDIYSKYGASTKRDTNTQIGMLGIGCKSALTYTDQFSLIGIKDGIKTFVNISRNAEGAGVMEIVESVISDDPNGVEILIPVKPVNNIKSKAQKFFKYWPKGSVLLDGADPTLDLTLIDLGDGILARQSNDADVLIMGNVAYPLPNMESFNTGYHPGWQFIHYCPLGNVDFTPSREQLHMTKRTKEYIALKRTQTEKNFLRYIEDDISKADTKAKALEVYAKWRNYSNIKGKVKFKGEEIPNGFKIPVGEKGWSLYGVNNTIGNVSAHAINSIETLYLGGTRWFIVGFPCKQPSANQKRKIQKYFNTKNGSVYLLTQNKFGDGWFDDYIVYWPNISKIELPKNSNAPKTVPFSFEAVTNGTWTTITAASTTLPAYYINWTNYIDNGAGSLKGRMVDLSKRLQCQIIFVAINRTAKFLRENPTVRNIVDVVNDWGNTFFNSLTPDEQWQLFGTENYRLRDFATLNINEIKDPELKEALRRDNLINVSTVKLAEQEYLEKLERIFKPSIKFDKPKIVANNDSSVFVNRYPLANSNYPSHTLRYINMIYEEK